MKESPHPLQIEPEPARCYSCGGYQRPKLSYVSLAANLPAGFRVKREFHAFLNANITCKILAFLLCNCGINNLVVNCPHFRPDTQHKQEGSSNEFDRLT